MKSIFSRLIFSFLAILLIAIFFISIVFPGLLKNYLIDQKETELENKCNQIVSIARDYMNNRMSQYTLSYMFNSIDKVVDSNTLLIDKTGTILYTPSSSNLNGSGSPQIGMKISDTDLFQIFNGLTLKKVGYSTMYSEPMITVGVPIYSAVDRSGIMGAVIVSSPAVGVSETIGRMNMLLIFTSLGALAFSLLTAYFLSKSLSKPIHIISSTALEIAEGNYSKKVDINRKDEIGKLSSAFNYLTEKLNETIGDLNNEKTKLSGILYSMEEGLIAVDIYLNIIHINPAALALFNINNLSHNKLSDIEGGSSIIGNVKEVLSCGKSISYERKISEDRSLNILISPLKMQDGRTYGAIILIQDISETVKLEKMRRDFVANVSHELRTPLTSIRGFIEPLIDGTVVDDKTTLKYHMIIRDETQRLERLINDLLDLSRLQAGKIKLDMQKVNIIELISNISDKFKPLFDSKNIKFEFHIPNNPFSILADGDRIEQLMIIFIDNAIKYTPQGGHIGINIAENDGLARISIKDSGIGIPEEDIPYIWDRFYKVDKSRTDKNSGTGLGLSIAKNIIELHGQKVFVKSKLGEGTTFEFTMKKSE